MANLCNKSKIENEMIVHWRRSFDLDALDNMRLHRLKDAKLFGYVHPNIFTFSRTIRCQNYIPFEQNEEQVKQIPSHYSSNFDMRNFISALVMLCKKPVIIRRLFQEMTSNRSGIYILYLFKNGKPVTVTIDDLIPCGYYSKPLFLNID